MSGNGLSSMNMLGGLPYYRNQRQHPHGSFLRQLSQILWEDSERISSLEHELRDLKTINGRLQLDIKSKDDALAKWRAHDLSVSEQLKEYDQLAKDLSRDKEDLLKRLESQPSGTQHLREQNKALKEQLADADENAKTLKESYSQQEDAFRTKIKSLEDEAARRELALFDLRSELEELKDEHTELQSSRDTFAKDYEKLDQDVVALREELDGEKQCNQALRTDAAAGAEQLQEGCATLEMVRKEVASLFDSLLPFLEEKTQGGMRLKDERCSNASLELKLIAIRRAIDSMLHANQGLKNKLEASNYEKAQLQTDVTSANKRCVELEGKNRSLDSRLSSLQSKQDRLQLEVKDMRADKSQLKDQMRSNEERLISTESELQQAQAKASRIEDERGRLDRELFEKKRTLKKMCHNFDKLKRESKKLGEDNTAFTSKLSEQSKTVKQLQDQLSEYKLENEELHDLQKKSKDDLRAKQNLADAFESRVKYLDEQIDELRSDLKRKEEEMSAAREFIRQQHAARDDYIRATATPSPFQPVAACGGSSQAYCKDVPMDSLEQTSPSKLIPSSKISSSLTSPLGNKVAATPHKPSDATEEGDIKVSPAASVLDNAQHDNAGRNSRLESRDPRLNRIKFSLSPQKRSIDSVHQGKDKGNPKDPKKSRSM
ncbi:hypothetical protein KC338_g1830 [Hortaea werneckii]|nr:hypothetical protein KC338_g1830 [Hortaea werneckii]KAI7352505.1 hypothetical protein KC320_g4412 [Hortaea werneckii]